MVSSNNKDACIVGSSTEGKVEVKLVATQVLLRISSLAVKNFRAATKL